MDHSVIGGVIVVFIVILIAVLSARNKPSQGKDPQAAPPKIRHTMSRLNKTRVYRRFVLTNS